MFSLKDLIVPINPFNLGNYQLEHFDCTIEQGIKELPMDSEKIPDFVTLSKRLQKHSGWTVAAVPGLVPHNISLFIYPPMDDFIQSCGQAAVKVLQLKQADVIKRIVRLYCYIAVGLVQEEDGIRSYGAAIASSEKEILFSLESDLPNLVMFDVERVMRSEFWIYDLQQTYFVIKDMNELLTIARLNLEAITKKLNSTPDIELGDLVAEDHVIQYGTLRYHEKKQLQASAA